MLTLIHHTLCPLSRSIRLALAECGLRAELVEEQPWSWRDEFLDLNPAGNLPVLIAETGEAICGVYPISEYLAETSAQPSEEASGFSLFPGDVKGRAETRRLIDWFHSKFNSEVSACVLEEKIYRTASNGSEGPNIAALRAAQDNLRYHLSYIGHLIEERHWLAGEELSFADLAAAGQLSSMDYLGDVPWEVNEAAKTWYSRVKSRPSFRQLLKDRVAGLAPVTHYVVLDF